MREPKPPARPLRLGVLGAAAIVPAALGAPVRDWPLVQLTSIASRSPDRAGRLARRLGIPRVAPTYDALLADRDVDAVYIALPNSHHAEWTVRALRAGKHVLVEKPGAVNAAEARLVAAEAAASGRVVMEAFHTLYHPLADRLRDLIASGILGEIRHFRSTFVAPILARGDIRWSYPLGGGALLDLGCYALRLLSFLGGDYEIESARTLGTRGLVDRGMEARLRFGAGPTGHVTCSMLSPRLLAASLTIDGTDGWLRVLNPFAPQYGHLVATRTRRGGLQLERIRSRSSYFHQLRAFTYAVFEGAAHRTAPQTTVTNLEAIDRIYTLAGLPLRQGLLSTDG